jgi:uncharacterized phage protein (TIGR01671 family)
MNRELKFRVYSHVKDDDSSHGYLETDSGEYHGAYFFFDGGWRPVVMFFNKEHFVPQQYTGCKDKNGKMIFEGDILRQSDLRFEIRFESFQWVAVCPYYNKYHHPRIEHFRLCASGEVIGNIMENPELLKA